MEQKIKRTVRKLSRSDEVPEPFDELALPKEKRFWPVEPWDVNLPKPAGFLNDFVFYTRGVAAPTPFAFWTAVSLVASVLKREAWIPWGLKHLYPNFYIILVAPPGIAKKGSIMGHGVDLLLGSKKYYVSANVAVMKNLKILRNKATPEALAVAMLPEKRVYELRDAQGRVVRGEDGRPRVYKPTSEISIIVPELESMLGKVEYTRGMTGFLMDIYDPHDTWEVNTISRGKEVLRNLCTTFIGATTPIGLKKSISDVALEDGFLCRSTLVFQARATRRYSMPRVVDGGPPKEEMMRRLAWIGENMMGAFSLTSDAQTFYDTWYEKFMDEMEERSEHAYAYSRMDIQVLKLALIIRASRYDPGKEISKQDIETAVNIIQRTALTYGQLFRDVDSAAFMGKIDRVGDYLRKRTKASRGKLLASTRLTADEISSAINNLLQAGKIEVWRDGRKQQFPGRDCKEEYRWIGGNGHQQEEDDE